MHEDLSVTDGVYSILSETNVKKQIKGLGKQIAESGLSSIEELISLNQQILEIVKQQGPGK